MLYDLSELYGSSLTKQRIKPLLPLFSEARIRVDSVYLGDNIEKILPGMVAISNTMPAGRCTGITYAIGRLFVKHFDSGAWLEGSIGNECISCSVPIASLAKGT